MKWIQSMIALAIAFACFGCGSISDEVKQQWARFEGSSKQMIEISERRAEREAQMLATFKPKDEAAIQSLANLRAAIDADRAREVELTSAQLEAMRAIGAFFLSPPLFGDREEQTRMDERLLLFLQAFKAKNGE